MRDFPCLEVRGLGFGPPLVLEGGVALVEELRGLLAGRLGIGRRPSARQRTPRRDGGAQEQREGGVSQTSDRDHLVVQGSVVVGLVVRARRGGWLRRGRVGRGRGKRW